MYVGTTFDHQKIQNWRSVCKHGLAVGDHTLPAGYVGEWHIPCTVQSIRGVKYSGNKLLWCSRVTFHKRARCFKEQTFHSIPFCRIVSSNRLMHDFCTGDKHYFPILVFKKLYFQRYEKCKDNSFENNLLCSSYIIMIWPLIHPL